MWFKKLFQLAPPARASIITPIDVDFGLTRMITVVKLGLVWTLGIPRIIEVRRYPWTEVWSNTIDGEVTLTLSNCANLQDNSVL